MAKLFLKPASDGLYHHSYDPMSIMTMDFRWPSVSRVIETVPSDHFSKIYARGEMQLAPQVFPPFGRLYFRTASFFVPEHQIFSASEAYHSNQTMYKGRSFKVPNFNLYEAMNVPLTAYSSLVQTVSSASSPTSPAIDYPPEYSYDFQTIERSSGNTIVSFWKLSAEGYRYYSFFKSLGYDFVSLPYPFDMTVPTGYADIVAYLTSINTYCNKRSAMPILAYAKIYADYFMPGQFFNGDNMVKLLQSIHDMADMSSYYTASTGVLTAAAIQLIYDTCKTPVVQDMYTSAWNSPNSPLGVSPSDYGSFNNGSLISPYISQISTSSNDKVTQNSDFVQSLSHSNGYLGNLNSFGVRIQRAVEQFVVRNNLVGSKPIMRTLARFGIKPSDATSHFVSKLYEGSELIKFHPVLSNSVDVSMGSTVNDNIG